MNMHISFFQILNILFILNQETITTAPEGYLLEEDLFGAKCKLYTHRYFVVYMGVK